MHDLPVHLRYTLDRKQRLVPHLRIWGKGLSIAATLAFIFFFSQTIYCIVVLEPIGTLLLGTIAFLIYALGRRLFNGLWDALVTQVRVMDIIIDDQTLGLLMDDERWYLFLDGFVSIDQYYEDVWTLQHFNGAVVNIPTSVIDPETLNLIRRQMKHARTPEGIREVIERGRNIQQILDGRE